MIRGLLRRHSRHWFLAVAVLLAATAAALTPAPSAIAEATAGGQRAFAALASAAVVTLAILPFILWRNAARRRVWGAVAVLSLTFGIASFPAAAYVERSCTARYGSKPVIIGADLTPLGVAYKQANPELSSDDLLLDAAGAPERIWTRSSIGRCGALVSSTYFLWIPLLVICLAATAQAVPATILAPMHRGTPAPDVEHETKVRYDVFVSYRHDRVDRTFATELVSALEAEGYSVAIDEREFGANASFLQEMERAIRQSRFTVAVISPRYLQSGHTEEEAIIAKVLDMGDRKRRLIPIVIEPVVMPAWLYGIVGIDWTKDDPSVDPFDKLKATLGAPLADSNDS